MITKIYNGDITEAKVEAIVNAANNHLWMGSGVAGAIKRKGGKTIEAEAIALGPIEMGQAVATGAGNLPYKNIIHAAGMGQDLQTSKELIYECTKSSLELAEKIGLTSLAFPAIGTGVGGLSFAVCARSMKKAIAEFASQAKNLTEIHFVIFGEDETSEFDKVFK